MRLVRLLGDLQARVVLTVIYLTLVLPTGLVARLFSDPLQRRGGPRWHARKGTRDTSQTSRNQF